MKSAFHRVSASPTDPKSAFHRVSASPLCIFPPPGLRMPMALPLLLPFPPNLVPEPVAQVTSETVSSSSRNRKRARPAKKGEIEQIFQVHKLKAESGVYSCPLDAFHKIHADLQGCGFDINSKTLSKLACNIRPRTLRPYELLASSSITTFRMRHPAGFIRSIIFIKVEFTDGVKFRFPCTITRCAHQRPNTSVSVFGESFIYDDDNNNNKDGRSVCVWQERKGVKERLECVIGPEFRTHERRFLKLFLSFHKDLNLFFQIRGPIQSICAETKKHKSRDLVVRQDFIFERL